MSVIRRLGRFLIPHWKTSLLAMIMLVLTVFLDLSIPRLIQDVIDRGVTARDMNVVINITLIMLSVIALSAILTVGNTFLAVRVGQSFGADVREVLYAKIKTLSFRNLDQLQIGQLIVRLTSDIRLLQMVVTMMLRILTRAPLLMVGSALFLLATGSDLAQLMLLILPPTGIIIFFFIRKAQPVFLKVQARLDTLNQILQEDLAGIRVVKAFVRSDYEIQRFDKANVELAEETIKVQRILSFVFPTIILIINLGVALVLWVGGLKVIEGGHTIGEILAFISYLLTALFPIALLAIFSGQISAAYASGKRIMEILDAKPDIQESVNPKVLEEEKGRVVFDNVCFSYARKCDEAVLTGINLVAEPGQTVALIGATGSGKSSLVQLIPRFYDVCNVCIHASGGKVTIDEVDVRKISLKQLRSTVGIVFQETFLFGGTIKENIRFGNPKASDKEVVESAKIAQAHDFIMDFPKGYDTIVGQRGVTLSGGQKQRINIARTLLGNPKILILDDSTSSVDVETEAKIHGALQKKKNCTTFIIAQRISTVLTADKIVVLERGKIVAEGSHQSLMDTTSIYKEIYDSQLGNGGPNHE